VLDAVPREHVDLAVLELDRDLNLHLAVGGAPDAATSSARPSRSAASPNQWETIS
jgi:hypothetical protein